MAQNALSERELDELIEREDKHVAEVDWWTEHLLHHSENPTWRSREDYRRKANHQGS